MKNITSNIGRACLISCFAGAVTMLLSWQYAWLGIIVAFLVAYIAYEFHEVLQAIPKAWQEVRGFARSDEARTFYKWLLTSPCAHLGAVISTTALIGICQEYGFSWWMLLVVPFSYYVGANLLIVFLTFLPGVIAWKEMGNRLKKEGEKLSMQEATSRISYRNLLWLVGQNLIFPVIGPVLFLKFLWQVFRLIHSERRTVCAFNSATTTAIFYMFFFSRNMQKQEHFIFVFSCAILGAVVGVLEWKLFGERLAKLKTSHTV